MAPPDPVQQPPRRLHLVHGPTPMDRVQLPGGFAARDVELWVKRDDATGGACAGNKLRKLELLMADALARGASHVVTCGGIQSNHARATALVAARLGLRATLMLRTADPRSDPPASGNVLLDRLAGASVRLVTPAEYAQRDAYMASIAAELAGRGERPYVIPEGGSNGLGALGYVRAMREVREQLDLGLGGGRAPFDVVVHACGSGGTAAGIALGARRWNVAARVRSVVVCDDAAYFRGVVLRVAREAMAWGDLDDGPALVEFDEHARGPRYGVMDAAQRALLVAVCRATGLVLDPVYTGKAFFGLEAAVSRGDIAKDARVLFVHTGGLPGLLAEGDAFAGEL